MKENAPLAGRRALVTGASRGIGAAIAAELAARGAEVWRPERGQLDLADAASVHAFVAAMTPVDILVNNAGINLIAPLDVIQDMDWDSMFAVNVASPRRLIQGVASGMQQRGWGRIVNIGSIFGQVSKEGRAAYSATKA